MKRVGYLYDKLCDIDFIKTAIIKASKGKSNRFYVRKVLNDIDFYANKLKVMLETDSVVLSPNKLREIHDHSSNKLRIITIPKFFPDQVIHWLLVLQLEPVMTKGLYRFNCGSIPNRGGIEAHRATIRAVKDKRMKYVLKLDIRKFFNNINADILMQMFRKKVKDERFLNLVNMVLKNTDGGLPIGYYTSQWFSNFYLQDFDHFVKEKLKIKYYVRYVDDMVLIDSNKRKLHKAIKVINDYLHTISLELKGNYQLWSLDSRPIDFVGYKFTREKVELRRKIYFRTLKQVRKVKKSGYVTISQARNGIALIGWLKHITYGFIFYFKKIFPFMQKFKLRKIISDYDKKQSKKENELWQRYSIKKNGKNKQTNKLQVAF